MGKRWNYNGDINIEYGGYFWREDGSDDHVLCVRVQPCSDAGGPENMYWIEQGSICMPDDPEKRRRVLSVIGQENNPEPTRDMLVDAYLAYGYDCMNGSIMVQVGPKQEARREWNSAIEPQVVLRSNANLRNYVRRNYLT